MSAEQPQTNLPHAEAQPSPVRVSVTFFVPVTLVRSQQSPNATDPANADAASQDAGTAIPNEMTFFIPLGFMSTNGSEMPAGTSFEDLLDRLMRQHQPQGPPPTSKDVLSKLPEKTADGALLSEVCTVCQDNYQTNDKLWELPCGHQFHIDCAKPWLEQHCTCPVCRYELPVDDQEYEVERQKRMAARHNKDVEPSAQSTFSSNTVVENPSAAAMDVDNTSNLSADPMEIDSIEQPSHIVADGSVSCSLSQINHEPCTLLRPASYHTLSCGHNFHTECLETYLRVSNELSPNQDLHCTDYVQCPTCRQRAQVLPVFDLD